MRKYRYWILSLGIVAAPNLAVAEPSPFGHEPQTASRPAEGQTNQQVAEHIAQTLRVAKLPGSNIDITVTSGVARLAGQIANDRAKAAATQIVARVPGVKRVDNQLQVPAMNRPELGVQQAAFNRPFGQEAPIQQVAQNPSPVMVPAPAPPAGPPATDNQVMAERIGSALSSAQLNGYQIKIRYAQGTATLAGSVATPQQKMVADQVVRSVAGVNAVNNQLQVSGAGMQQPSPLQQVAYQPGPAGQPPMGPPAGAPPAGAPGVPGGYPGGGYPGGGYPGGGYPGGMMGPGPGGVMGNAVPGANPSIYNQPYMPKYSWPAQAQYPNSAAIQYPKQYSASAWPYIGPFYPYPQVPLGWRKATLEWDDGHWMMDFDSKTDRWFWFLNPKNW